MLITVDAVAIGQIGHIRNEYLQQVPRRIEDGVRYRAVVRVYQTQSLQRNRLLDVAEKTIEAVARAMTKTRSVKAGDAV